MKDEEGRIEVDGHQVWYRRVGEGGIPLLLLTTTSSRSPTFPRAAR
jgi:hypothetical protein